MVNTTTLKVFREDRDVVESVKLQLSLREKKKVHSETAFHFIIQEWRQLRKEAK